MSAASILSPRNTRRFLYGVGFVLALYCGGNYTLFGRPFPISKIDELEHPQRLINWDAHGLNLSDGRKVMPKGMITLPERSDTIALSTSSGVEIDSAGRAWVLVKLWHWCGNDAVKYDLRRLDLAQILAYHHEGKSATKLFRYSKHSFVEFGGGSERGWSISDYVGMNHAFDPKLVHF